MPSLLRPQPHQHASQHHLQQLQGQLGALALLLAQRGGGLLRGAARPRAGVVGAASGEEGKGCWWAGCGPQALVGAQNSSVSATAQRRQLQGAHLRGSLSAAAAAAGVAPGAPPAGVRAGQPPGGACRGIHWLWGTVQSRDLRAGEGWAVSSELGQAGSEPAASGGNSAAAGPLQPGAHQWPVWPHL